MIAKLRRKADSPKMILPVNISRFVKSCLPMGFETSLIPILCYPKSPKKAKYPKNDSAIVMSPNPSAPNTRAR